jgi:hypothetical protein
MKVIGWPKRIELRKTHRKRDGLYRRLFEMFRDNPEMTATEALTLVHDEGRA